jgi:hypothetical protein
LKLPTYKDDEEQTIELSTSQFNSKSLPSFVTFDSTSLAYSIKPLSVDQLGSYPIQVSLTDSAGATKSYLFNIDVNLTNEGETSSMINRSSLNMKGGKNNLNINASMAI